MSFKSRQSRFSNILDGASGQAAAKVALNRKSPATAAWREWKAGALVLVLTVSLCAPPAQAGPGDLDPSFADHGRLGHIPRAAGSARSIELLDEGGILVGGGNFGLAYWESPCILYTDNFASKLGENGAVDPAFKHKKVASMAAFDFARQADGGIVVAGRKITRGLTSCRFSSRLAVHKLASDGSLDSTFGTGGIFEWNNGRFSGADSIALEPDGRIVVAGAGISGLVVLRLLSNGDLDQTFGVGGVYVGPAIGAGEIRLARTTAGGYRISAPVRDGCAILALTARGVLSAAFGDAGIAMVGSAGAQPVGRCQSLAVLPNNRLLVAGSIGNDIFVSRLLANGAPDPTFTADTSIADYMTEATSIIAAGNNKVLVAGTGPDGASIMRLLASGQRDTRFGAAGVTWIDLRTDPSTPIVREMAVREDGSVFAVGGTNSMVPFVVKLIGDNGGTGPGVVGFARNVASRSESDGRPAVLRVRRRGGSDGDVSVGYRTEQGQGAISGVDFQAKTGTLYWADGDTSDRVIAVEIVQDGIPAEGSEYFQVLLDAAQGGAGIGTQRATIRIDD